MAVFVADRHDYVPAPCPECGARPKWVATKRAHVIEHQPGGMCAARSHAERGR